MQKIRGSLDRYGLALVRIALGLLFVYFAWDKFQSPVSTAVIIQASVMSAVMPTSNLAIYMIAIAELIVGIGLIFSIQAQKAALLAAVLLAGIVVIAQIPQDIILFFVALYLSTKHAAKTI